MAEPASHSSAPVSFTPHDPVTTAREVREIQSQNAVDNPRLASLPVHLGALTKLTQLMSDKAMLNVVTTALGIPAAFANLDYSQQVAILQPRVDMSQFSTATGVAKFVDKYLAMDQLNQVTSGSSGDPILTLFDNSSSSDSSGGNQGFTFSAQSLAPRALNLFA